MARVKRRRSSTADLEVVISPEVAVLVGGEVRADQLDVVDAEHQHHQVHGHHVDDGHDGHGVHPRAPQVDDARHVEEHLREAVGQARGRGGWV